MRWRSSTNWSRCRGPYTGCLGYLGFNCESQLNILNRTAVCREGKAWFHVGAGIVADSDPEAEYEETLNKAAGWLAALNLPASALPCPHPARPTSARDRPRYHPQHRMHPRRGFRRSIHLSQHLGSNPAVASSLLALVSLVIGFMMIWDGISGSFPLKPHWSNRQRRGRFSSGDVPEPVGGKA